jgi:UTP--glucose-1-phosphate uridylyltransferase
MRPTRCIIPAAGLGTRFLPATKSMPKEMLPALDRPVIQYVVEEAASAGLTEVLIVTGRGKRAIEDHFDHSAELDAALSSSRSRGHLDELQELSQRVSLHYVRQRHQRGLADAVYQGRHFVGDEPFVVLLGDTIFTDPPASSKLAGRSCTQQLVEAFDMLSDPVLSVERVRPEKIQDYGMVALDDRAPPRLPRSGAAYRGRVHRIRDLVEKPAPDEAPSDLGIVGAYALTADIFGAIERTRPGKNGEVQLTDAIRRLLKRRPVWAFEFDGRRLDIGTKQDWLRANLILALEEEPWRSTVEEVLLGAAKPALPGAKGAPKRRSRGGRGVPRARPTAYKRA